MGAEDIKRQSLNVFRMKLLGAEVKVVNSGTATLKIIEKLQTQNFNRIRIGIGSPPSIKGTNNFNTISHVLGNISVEEKLILDKVYKKVIESLEQLNTRKEEFIVNELNSFDKDKI